MKTVSVTNKLLKQTQPYEICCFDLFGILLLRTVYDMNEFYLRVGAYLRDSYPRYNDIPPEVFQSLRIEAQKQAENASGTSSHVTLEDISTRMRNFNGLDKCYSTAEQRVLENCCYINPQIYELIAQLLTAGKRVVLFTDKPYTEDDCLRLLLNIGFDKKLLERINILVCSQKRFFERLSAYNGGVGSNVIYIGNCYTKDIKTITYFDDFSYISSVLRMEKNCYSSKLGELYDLRRLSAFDLPDDVETEEEAFWYQLGSGVYGPLYACYAHWVVRQAVKNKAKYILPFMREGELLKILIEAAVKEYGVDIDVVPVYISRYPARTINTNFSDPRSLQEHFMRGRLKVKDLCRFLFTDINNTPFSHLSEKTIYQCRQEGSFGIVEEYFYSEDVRKQLAIGAKKQEKLLADYVRAIIGDEDAVTVDIGYEGTLHHALVLAMRNNAYNNKLSFRPMIGTIKSIKWLLDGYDMGGWLGYGGENEHLLWLFHQRIQPLEILMMANCGTTLGYTDEECIVKPVLDSYRTSKNERRIQDLFWRGLAAFQQYWFCFCKQKKEISQQAMECKESFIQIHRRLSYMPMYQEAVYMGKLVFENIIVDSADISLCKPFDFELYDKCGSADEFLSLAYNNFSRYNMPGKGRILWPEAIVVQRNPQYFTYKYSKENENRDLARLLDIYKEHDLFNKRVTIWGAGSYGKRFLKSAAEIGLKVEFVIDSDKLQDGLSLYGIPVISPEHSIGRTDAIIITPRGYSREIRKLIAELFAGFEAPVVADFFDDINT